MVILEAKEIIKSYGPKKVLDGITFQLQQGQCLGVLGGSGSGKSVLMRSMIGLEGLDAGMIYFKGQRIDHLQEEELFTIRQKVAYIFQSGALFDSETVYANVAFSLWEHSHLPEAQVNSKVQQALSNLGLKDNDQIKPSELSGGMQKRVSIARALVMDPEILIFDEPTAGLDPNNTKKIANIILDLKSKNLSLIIVTHDLPLAAKVCDEVLLIEEGKVAYQGKATEFEQDTAPAVKRFLGEEEVNHETNQ